MVVSRFSTAQFGATNTAAIVAGGQRFSGPAATAASAAVEQWNGTNWTEVGDLGTARKQLAGAGTSTSGLAFGGENPSNASLTVTESWNGTNWTEVNDLNNSVHYNSGAGADNTSALGFGGANPATPAVLAVTESWNGTNWTNENNLNAAVQFSYGSGAQTTALSAGGSNPPTTAATEEWVYNAVLTENID